MIYGFLGAGHLASTIVEGLIKQGTNPKEIFVSSPRSAQLLADKTGVTAVSATELIQKSDIVILAFLPQQLEQIVQQAGQEIFAGRVLVSLLGSTTLSQLKLLLPSAEIVRAMPNVNAEFNRSATALCAADSVSSQSEKNIRELFLKVGSVTTLSEDLFPAFSALAGSGPAFVAMFLKGLQQAGIKLGMSEDDSLKTALDTVLGSTLAMQKSGQQPDQVIKAVASPGGSTALGVASFQDNHFLAIIEKAIESTAAYGKK